MNINIRDTAVFQSLSPLQLVAYLRTTGWIKTDDFGDNAAIWANTGVDGQEAELLVPLDRSIGDYTLRIAEAFHTVAKVEGRSTLALLQDIQRSGVDTIRVKLRAEPNSTGTIRFEDGVDAVANTSSMMLAAACSAVEPREYFHARKFRDATDYVRRLKMGQTESGSFVLTVLSSVPPVLRPQTQLFDNEDSSDEPFERQVTRTLMCGLQAAQGAARQAVATGDITPFTRAVSDGVSANLCDALLGLAGPDQNSPFEIYLSWATNRQAPKQDEVPNKICLTPDVFPVFEEVSRVFKAKSPREEFELEGVVIRLHREKDSGPGRVIVMGAVEGKTRKVSVDLSEQDFVEAIRAFEDRTPVRVLGELHRSRSGFQLKNNRHFEARPDE